MIHSPEDIEAVLTDLNASVTGPASLHRWQERTHVEVARVNEGSYLAFIRLAGRDHHARPVVLMLIEGTWQRAI